MVADQQLLEVVSRIGHSTVEGQYLRHLAAKRLPDALTGYDGGARWNPPHTFPALYFTDDHRSCVVEAYRHMQEAILDLPADQEIQIAPRALLTAQIHASRILDLTKPAARVVLGLDPAIFFSEPQTPTNGAAYQSCGRVAVAAHRLDYHGILAPAATQYGHTLVLFTDKLPEDERPVLVGEPVIWTSLPPDPRVLRIVSQEHPT
jgi:RES domain-containing protein